MAHVRCPRCDTRFGAAPGALVRCPACGHRGGRVPEAPPAATPSEDPAGATAPPPVPGAARPVPAPGAPAEVPATNALAIIAFVLALVSVFIGWMPLPVPGVLPVVAVGLGIGALAQIDRSGEQGRGLATAAIVVGGVVAMLVLVFWAVFRMVPWMV